MNIDLKDRPQRARRVVLKCQLIADYLCLSLFGSPGLWVCSLLRADRPYPDTDTIALTG